VSAPVPRHGFNFVTASELIVRLGCSSHIVCMDEPPERARPARADIVAKGADGSLLDALFGEWGRYAFKDDDPLIAELAAAYNAGDVDLLSIITPEAMEEYKAKRTFFSGQHLYRALISKLDASAEALLRAVNTLLEAGGSDLAANLPVEEFAKWCAADPKRPRELVELVDRDMPDAEKYLTIALTKGAEVDHAYFVERAYEFVEGGDDVKRRTSINALGQIRFSRPSDYYRFSTGMRTLVEVGANDSTRAVVLRAAICRLESAPAKYRPQLIRLADLVLSYGGDIVLHEAATILAFNFENLPVELIEPMLTALRGLNPDNKGTIEHLDWGLQHLVQKGQPDRARLLLEHLLCREDGVTLEQFDAVTNQLITGGGAVLEDWVVEWLRMGDAVLCKEMDEHLFGAGSDEFTFNIDFRRFALEDAEYGFIARKAIGSFFLKARIMASILVSLVRSAPADAVDEIEELLIDPILVNYSGVARDYLQPIAEDENDPAARVAQSALDGLAQYIEGLRSIGSVPELHPSERERQLEWQRHSDQMSAAWQNARKQSIFASIVTESVMLYGNRSINWVADPAGERRRIETELASIGHSFEIPRIDTVDPLGLQLMLLSFRQEQSPA
jgi:hypothetical protein